MLFRRQPRRERVAARLRQLLPSRRMAAVVGGAAALALANSRVTAARRNSE